MNPMNPLGGAYPVSGRRLPTNAGNTAADLQVEGGGFAAELEALLRRQAEPAPAGAADAAPAAESVRFSRHAAARLESRDIALSDADMADLGAAIDRLGGRGARESLVLMDDHAFIVGVPRRTVITAMSRNEAMGNVFTQIDSTLVVR